MRGTVWLVAFVLGCGGTTTTNSDDPGGDGGKTDDGNSTTDGGTDSGGDAATIWQPPPGTSWQWQLTGTIDTSLAVAMYDIDLFDAPQATIDELHDAGRIVICYFSQVATRTGGPTRASFRPRRLATSSTAGPANAGSTHARSPFAPS